MLESKKIINSVSPMTQGVCNFQLASKFNSLRVQQLVICMLDESFSYVTVREDAESFRTRLQNNGKSVGSIHRSSMLIIIS